MNEQLRIVYESAFPIIQGIIEQEQAVSWPLFLEVPEGYSSLPIKWMVVGQQTNGWWNTNNIAPATVETVLAAYRSFDLGRGYSSPFWHAAHELHYLLNPRTSRYFLWSNIIKVCQHKTRPQPRIEDCVCNLRILQEEIRITQPDAIIFFTGPTYDGRLRETFSGVSIERLSRCVSRVTHPDLPRHTYRLYHPNYLRRSRNWRVLQDIASYVRGERDPDAAVEQQ